MSTTREDRRPEAEEPEPLPIPPALPPFEGEADLSFPAEDEPPRAIDEDPVAWRADVDVHDVVIIVFAQRRGQARFTVWESAREVGYQIGFGDVKVRRAPEYDQAQLRSGERPKPRKPYGVMAFSAA